MIIYLALDKKPNNDAIIGYANDKITEKTTMQIKR